MNTCVHIESKTLLRKTQQLVSGRGLIPRILMAAYSSPGCEFCIAYNCYRTLPLSTLLPPTYIL